jgi:dUTP pyrophosphatase
MSKAKTENLTSKNKNTTLSKSPMLEEKVKFFKLNEGVQLPTFATNEAACFDVYANLLPDMNVQYYGAIQTKELPRRVSFDINSNRSFVQLNNMERMLIPTGLIADIPVGFSIRLHSRSGLAFKQGVYLANCEGIIDSDYIDPIFALVTSLSNVPVKIFNGDRICQGELVRCEKYTLDETDEAPIPSLNMSMRRVSVQREGGFGSTGT